MQIASTNNNLEEKKEKTIKGELNTLQEESLNLVKKNKAPIEVLKLKYSPKIKSKKDRTMK